MMTIDLFKEFKITQIREVKGVCAFPQKSIFKPFSNSLNSTKMPDVILKTKTEETIKNKEASKTETNHRLSNKEIEAEIKCEEPKNKSDSYYMLENTIKDIILIPNQPFVHKRKEFHFINEEQVKEHLLESYLCYSRNNHCPFSFSFGQKNYSFDKSKLPLELKYPSPKYLIYDDFTQIPEKLIYENFMKGSEVHKEKGVIAVDSHLLKRFSGIVGDMISQILKRLFGGPPVSLNVKIFEPKSTLQRNIESWSYAPVYLKKASARDITPIERMKLVTSFSVAGLILTCKQLKPFNPLIGETFEGEFPDGSKVYGEHIGHYPTLSRFLIIDKENDYRLHCCFDLDAKTESFGGIIKIIQKGNITVEFPKINQKLVYRMPLMKLENCRSEKERNAYVYDYLEIYDITNKLKGMIEFGYNNKNITQFIGTIINYAVDIKHISSKEELKHTEKYMTMYKKFVEASKIKKESILAKNPEPLTYIHGCFTKDIYFDDQKIWDFASDEAFYVVPSKHVLPSDTRYREDLIWLFYALHYSRNKKEYELFMSYSQGWKAETEYLQRKEREIKAAGKKKNSIK